MLAVAGRIHVGDLTKAIGRGRRIFIASPPKRALLEFCRQIPQTTVKGEWIIADAARDAETAMTGGELRLVKILQKDGPVLHRSVLERLCVADGLNRFSFHAFLATSPVIVQFGSGVVGLLGTKPSPATIKALSAKARADRAGAE
jgi:hypothetical protein